MCVWEWGGGVASTVCLHLVYTHYIYIYILHTHSRPYTESRHASTIQIYKHVYVYVCMYVCVCVCVCIYIYIYIYIHPHTQKVKFTLEQTMKTQRASRGVPLLFNHGATWRQVVTATPRPLYPRERVPLSTVQEAEWDPGPVWTGAENLTHTRIRSP